MTRHLSTAGMTACAAVLVNLSVASSGGLDRDALGRPGVVGTPLGTRVDRTSRLFDLPDDERPTSSPPVTVLPRPFVTSAAAGPLAESPLALGTRTSRAVRVLLVAPKNGPPAGLV
jgi:hypothetical protein